MKKEIKPLFPLKHEFAASLDRFVQEAVMLRDAVATVLQMGVIEGRSAELIRERIAAFDAAK